MRTPRKRGQAAAPAMGSEGKRPLKTLERVLSKAGLGSRTEARHWITEGRVQVNGRPVLSPEHWVDMERDQVRFDNKPLQAKQRCYLLLYKPVGYLTTYRDPEGRPTVYDLLTDQPEWVFPVGRLDQDTSGLLLLTNDTAFAERVTNPEHKMPKTYLVKSSIVLSNEQVQMLRDGVQLSDGPTRPAQVTRLRDNASKSFIEITITEGRNRQVRRMIEALGGRVLKLVRTAIGPVAIGGQTMGTWRELTASELRALRGDTLKKAWPTNTPLRRI